MLNVGESPQAVAELLDVSERSVWRWQRLWRFGGDAALAAKPGRGRPPKLDAEQTGRVLAWIDRSACEFGFVTERWTAPRIAAVLRRELGVRMNHRYLSDWLDRHDITPQIPETRPRERDEPAIRQWIAQQWPLIKKR
jgi:transposase